ncbi:MAG TPA: hypothetical protein VGI43_16555 [Mucilaginibacter sp.]|jgi:hypothetical protein
MSGAYALNIASSVSGILPVLAAIFNYKYLDKILKIAALYFFISSLFDWVLELTKLGAKNNLPFTHLFCFISIVFFAAIYYHAFFNPLFKKIVLILAAIVFLIAIFNVVFIESIWEFPSISMTVLSVLVIFFSLAYFYQLLNRQEFIHIEKQGLFWINAGVLLYFSINLFLFMLLSKIISYKHEQDYYMIHIIVNIIANVLYTIGLLCKPQKMTSYQY